MNLTDTDRSRGGNRGLTNSLLQPAPRPFIRQTIYLRTLATLLPLFLVVNDHAVGADILVASNAIWKYLDNGSDQGTAWRQLSFNDSAWRSGPAQLGYGDGDEATVVGFGSDPNNKFITTYFRRAFQVPNAAAYAELGLQLLRDDGAVVYLNGTEIFRSNMPGGTIGFSTLAAVPGEDEVFRTTIPANLLLDGNNVLAAEVHQGARDSSDISFALEVSADALVTNCSPRAAGLIAWWPGDGVEVDIVGTNHGTLANGAAFALGKAGAAFRFDGVDDYVQINATNSVSGSFSVEMWVMPNHPTEILGIIGSRGPSDQSFDLKLLGGNRLYGDIGNGVAWIVTGTSGNFQYSTGAWYHIAYVVTPTNYAAFANGMRVGTGTFSQNTPLLFDASHRLRIGDTGYSGELMHGRIDEISIYNRALTSNEIAALYAAGSAGKCYTNDPTPVFLRQPLSQAGYVGSAISLDSFAIGAPRPTLQWRFNNSPIPGATNPSLILTNVTMSNAGAYSVVATSLAGVTTSLVATVTVLEAPFPTLPEGFEQGFAGWWVDDGVWEVGKPTGGPIGAHSGTNAASTGLGNYPPFADSRLISPLFTVPSAGLNPRFKFWHWFATELGYDYGQVQIRTNGGNWVNISPRFSGSSGCWAPYQIGLTDYAEKTVQIAFNFHSDYADQQGGWFIDDVRLLRAADILANPESFELGWGDWETDNCALWQIGVPTLGPPVSIPTDAHGALLWEDLEDGSLGRRITVERTGSFNSLPGIKSTTALGGTRAFGFGRSTCVASCFRSHLSRLSIAFPQPVYVSAILFKEIELFGNWGSHGQVLINGSVVPGSDFGREPYNDGQADSTFRLRQLSVERVVTSITLEVEDITGSSEIFIDDLIILAPPYGRRAFSPVSVAATLLSANYSANSQGRLISPRFIVPSVSSDSRVIFRFWQFYQYGTGDAGLVQVSTPYETNWTTVALVATNGTSVDWTLATLDLTPYQGQEILVSFLHSANGDGSVGAGWYLDDVSLSQFVPTRTPLDSPSAQQFTANRQSQYFVVPVPAGGHLRVTLDALTNSGFNELYVRRGALPTPGAFDFRHTGNGADQSVFVPNAGAGDWFILAYNDSGPVPGDYTLAVEFKTGVFLDSVAPSALPVDGIRTLLLTGAGFGDGDRVFLMSPGYTIEALAVNSLTASQLATEFSLLGQPTNTYSVRVVSGTNSSTLTNALMLVSAGQPKLVTRLVTPSQVGPGAPATIFVEYANEGTAAMPAPLLVLTGTDGARMSLQTARVISSFWTSARPQGFSETVQLLGSGATPGLLQPGERFKVPVQFIGLTAPDGFTVRFDLGVVTHNSTLTNPFVPWDSLKAQMRPASIPTEAWEPIWNNFTNATGPLWTDYVRMLNANAAYLARLGLTVTDVNDLLAFAIAQADGMNLIRSLASSTDATMPAPGLNLSFGRFFPQNLSARYRLGPLGRGWLHNWEVTLVEATDGTVTVTDPRGSRRVFLPDRRITGTYFSDIGDHGGLAKSGGSFTLTESGGLKRVFAADGKLTYAEDPNGNRITTTFSGNLLTKLAHSSGQSLTLAYSGGLLQSATDAAGRATMFSYDDGQHLASATYFDGTTVEYAYASGMGAARDHALTQVSYSGGPREFFSYDANGRLTTMQRDGGAEAITFGYEGVGLVSVTDVFTNKSWFYLNHRGLLAKMENPLRQTLQFNYDGEFNLTSFIDPAGRTHVYAYDLNGKLIETTDALGGRTRFAYGARNRLALLTDARGNLTRYSHDAKGNLNAITYANNSIERWGFDVTGNPTTWTNRRAHAIGYQFNTNGQLTAKNYPDGSRAIYGYDARGNLVLASNYMGTITLDYYTNDRLRRITYPGNRWLEYTYDSAGRRSSMSDQLGYRQDYLYDSLGRLHRMTNSTGELVRYDYYAAGRLALKTLGNGVFTTYHYDASGQLLALTNRQPDKNVLSFFNYTYDTRGRRIAAQTHYGAWTYGYDDLGQLTRAVLVSTYTNVPSQDLTYVYDALGNRIRTIENGVTTLYTANNLNQYTKAGGMTLNYDADGSLTQKLAGATTVLAITNNFENRVTGFGSTNDTRRFDYDALGYPAAIQRNSTKSFQVFQPNGAGNLVSGYDEGGVLKVRTSFVPGAILTEDGVSRDFLLFDGSGNPTESTDSIGASNAVMAFSPFGLRLNYSGEAKLFANFGGQVGVIDEGSLLVMGARLYAPELARFTSTDPTGIRGGDENLYRYVFNQPTAFVDPVGTEARRVRVTDTGDGYIFEEEGNYWGSLPQNDYYDRIRNLDKPPTWRWKWKYLHWILEEDRVVQAAEVYQLGVESALKRKLPEPYSYLPNPVGVGWSFLLGNATDNIGVGLNPWDGIPPVEYVLTPPGSFGAPGNSAEIPNGRPRDPNEKTGPAGYDTNHNYLAASSLFAYRINFENATNAQAPAQVVQLSDTLTNALDWSTLELTEIAFGDRFFTVPSGSQRYTRTEHVSYLGVNFDVELEVRFDPVNGILIARFDSINPLTGFPPSGASLIGFLPPEDGTGRGKGHVAFTIRPKSGLPTGTQIRNIAFITFDPESPGSPTLRTDLVDPNNPNSGINTNKQALVTVDADLPNSQVTSPMGTATNSSFVVCWTGSDLGSGVTGYDIYFRTNNGLWVPWLVNTPLNCATFHGLNARAYGFFAVAHDGAGNAELPPSTADTTVITLPNYPPSLAAVSNAFVVVGQSLNFTNFAADPDGPIVFSLGAGAPSGASLTSDGAFSWSPACEQGSSTNRITIWASDSGTPRMSNSITFAVVVSECVRVGIGSTVMLVSRNACVPIELLSTVALTNLDFRLDAPPDRLTNWMFETTHPNVATGIVHSVDASGMSLRIRTRPGTVLQGPAQVGRICFDAQHGSSAFVPLLVTAITGSKSDGLPVGNTFGVPGRAVVIGPEPLLEASLLPDGDVQLIIYGEPATTVRVEWGGQVPVGASGWNLHTETNLTALTTLLPPIRPSQQTRFFQAVVP